MCLARSEAFRCGIRSQACQIPNRAWDMKKQFLSQASYYQAFRKDIIRKFVGFSQIKNDFQVYQSMAGLFPTHVKDEGYFR